MDSLSSWSSAQRLLWLGAAWAGGGSNILVSPSVSASESESESEDLCIRWTCGGGWSSPESASVLCCTACSCCGSRGGPSSFEFTEDEDDNDEDGGGGGAFLAFSREARRGIFGLGMEISNGRIRHAVARCERRLVCLWRLGVVAVGS